MTTDRLVTLALLGVFHGVNPGMGWLFAVSIGLQERSRRGLVLSLPAIALGHEGAIALMVVVLTISSSLFAAKAVVLTGGAVLLAFGLWQLWSKRHVRWVGMRLNRWQLAGWSFVMSSAHGAGLMVLPVLAFPVDEDVSPLDLHRGLLSRVFTPRRMLAIEPQVRAFCARSLDPLVGAKRFDFIEDGAMREHQLARFGGAEQALGPALKSALDALFDSGKQAHCSNPNFEAASTIPAAAGAAAVPP